MSVHKCPNCGASLNSKVILELNNPRASAGWFNSTVNYSSPSRRPTSKFGWWRWIIFGEGRHLPDPPSNLVRVEVDLRTADNQMKINGGLFPLPIDKLRPVAQYYVLPGAKWNRENNTRVGLSQPEHHKLKYFLLDVGLLDVVNAREYRLNRAGLLCMRHITRL